MIHTFEQFINESKNSESTFSEFSKIKNILEKNNILIDNSGYRGDKTKHFALKNCDFFFDIEKEKYLSSNLRLENISNSKDLTYDYRNIENKEGNSNIKLIRIEFKND